MSDEGVKVLANSPQQTGTAEISSLLNVPKLVTYFRVVYCFNEDEKWFCALCMFI